MDGFCRTAVISVGGFCKTAAISVGGFCRTAMISVGGFYRTAVISGLSATLSTVMAAIGSMESFSESITVYLESVQLYLSTNAITEDRHVPVLLSLIGSKTNALLRSLVAPAKPGDKSFAELTRCLTDHFDPKPLVIAERFHFNQRTQSGGESVSEYVAELKRLAANCDFSQRLEEALRDRLLWLKE